jgi:hypothetical protein
MRKRKGRKKMSVVLPKTVNKDDKITLSGWRLLQQIGSEAMKNGNFTIEDVRKDLIDYRSKNEK